MATRADPTSTALLIAPTGAGSAWLAHASSSGSKLISSWAKLNLPTERWDDIKAAAHDRAFIVAGAQRRIC
ncbi:hypothetical protein [Candidatus Aalborgicola defluviihabitans]|uniref:hypothetical protein n=1 Tax=Candidatus Aalborgicola defluviihabitans TaxID=3386187 RepID=UPI0039B91BE6